MIESSWCLILDQDYNVQGFKDGVSIEFSITEDVIESDDGYERIRPKWSKDCTVTLSRLVKDNTDRSKTLKDYLFEFEEEHNLIPFQDKEIIFNGIKDNPVFREEELVVVYKDTDILTLLNQYFTFVSGISSYNNEPISYGYGQQFINNYFIKEIFLHKSNELKVTLIKDEETFILHYGLGEDYNWRVENKTLYDINLERGSEFDGLIFKIVKEVVEDPEYEFLL